MPVQVTQYWAEGSLVTRRDPEIDWYGESVEIVGHEVDNTAGSYADGSTLVQMTYSEAKRQKLV